MDDYSRGKGVRRGAQRYGPLIFGAAGAVVATRLLTRRSASDFARFMGPLPPVTVVLGSAVAGIAGLEVTRRRGFWSDPTRQRLGRGMLTASGVAAVFSTGAILADRLIGFPDDMNVEFPRSMAFYPAIAFVAEPVFHIIPLAAVTTIARLRYDDRPLCDRTTVLTIGAVSLVEPTAQVALGTTIPRFVVPHVAVIGVTQLLLLRWAGYVPMLWFRVVYYALWHVAWGGMRVGRFRSSAMTAGRSGSREVSVPIAGAPE